MPESWVGTLQVSRGTLDDEDVIWLEYLRAHPSAALLSRLDRSGLLAIREALIEDPDGFTQAVYAISEAIAPEILTEATA